MILKNRRIALKTCLWVACGLLMTTAHAQELSGFALQNSGWSRHLRPALEEAASVPNMVALTLIEPGVVMDFRSGEHLRQSYLAKNFSPSTDVGHGIISWKCMYRGEPLSGTIGMTGENSNQVRTMVRSGWGITPFISVFTDGYLQTRRAIDRNLDDVYSRGLRTRTIAVQVSELDCLRMLKFLEDFVEHPNNPQQNFGYLLDPEKFEGGGCMSFSTALFKRAGVLPEVFHDLFRRDVSAPSHLFGWDQEFPQEGPVHPFLPEWAKPKRPKHVSFYMFKMDFWDSQESPHINFKLFDPELLILAMDEMARSTFPEMSDADYRDYLRTYPFRRRIVAYPPDPTTIRRPRPDWIEYTGYQKQYLISENLDERTKVVAETARSWGRTLLTSGMRPKFIRYKPGAKSSGILLLTKNENSEP